MTTFHVWLIGREAPEVVQALEVSEHEGALWFLVAPPVYGESGAIHLSTRQFSPGEWWQWAEVRDATDHGS